VGVAANRITIAASAAAALVGAGLAIGIVGAFGGLSREDPETVFVGTPASQRAVTEIPVATGSNDELSVNAIYNRDAAGVVQVTSTSKSEQADPFFGAPETRTQRSLGSGFVIDKAGHIVTNEHVVAGAKSVEVSFSDNDSLKAKIVGVDASSDVAVLQIDARSRALTPLQLGNSDDVQVGDDVVAIGNPFGLDRSITRGIVSALQRPITAPNGMTIDHVIQTDAALNHGNSGGPLLNMRGQVVGVNSQIQTAGGDGNVGIGFAIPIDTVRNVVAQLIHDGRVEHPFLGIEAVPVTSQVARLFRLPASQGLLVKKVCRSGGATDAGLHGAEQTVVVAGESWPLGGDLIVAADGKRVGSTEALRAAVAAKKPGDEMKLTLFRGDNEMNVHVKLGRQPASLRC
jgi:S1-C subfamily serine protease